MRIRRTSPRRVAWTFVKGWLVAVAGIIVALTGTSQVRKLTRAHRGDGFPRTPPTEVPVSGSTVITTYT
ncbi:MAG: phosphatidylserine/phosphatidylglycerophosphate/cardiolipin synthase family protein, partial [Actinomycetes bacterium]